MLHRLNKQSNHQTKKFSLTKILELKHQNTKTKFVLLILVLVYEQLMKPTNKKKK